MGSVGSIRRFSECVVGFEGDGYSTQVGFRIGGVTWVGLTRSFSEGLMIPFPGLGSRS